MKKYFYTVDSVEFVDDKAFGQAWNEARELAKKEHKSIFRRVVNGDKVDYEYFAKGGCFLSMNNYKEGKELVF